MRGPWEALSSLARKLTTHFEIVTRRRALWNAITSESRTTCGKSGQLDPDWYSSVYPREKPDTHTHTRAYIYIYIHITWLNKILDSLTLPISLPSIEPGVPRWNSNDPLDPFRSPPDFFQSNISYQLRASISISRLKLPISPPGIWKATWKRSRSYAPLYYPCFKNLMFLSARGASRFRFNDDSFVVLFATSLVFFSNDLKKKRENTGDRFREIYTWKSYIFRHRIFFISVLVFFSSA